MIKLVSDIFSIFSNHISKSPVLKGLDMLFIGLQEQIDNKPVELDDLAKRLDKNTDDKIIELQKLEQLEFFAGELVVCNDIADAKNFALNLKLYFYNLDKKIILKETVKKLPYNILTVESKREVIEKNSIKYNINAPFDNN